MTNEEFVEEIAEYYASLLIVQYRAKEKAIAEIKLFATEMAASNIVEQVKSAYDVETAVGVQLDILGKYVGVDRGYQGALLSDDCYRIIIKLKIVRNTSDHTIKGANDALLKFFGSGVRATSNFNMTMNFWLDAFGSEVAQVAIDKDVLPRPMGVGSITIATPSPFFVLVPPNFTAYPKNYAGFLDNAADIVTTEARIITVEDIMGS